MKHKCVSLATYQTWLSVEKVYEGEVVVSPIEFSGGKWLYIKRADDGCPCYALSSQFTRVEQGYKPVGV